MMLRYQYQRNTMLMFWTITQLNDSAHCLNLFEVVTTNKRHMWATEHSHKQNWMHDVHIYEYESTCALRVYTTQRVFQDVNEDYSYSIVHLPLTWVYISIVYAQYATNYNNSSINPYIYIYEIIYRILLY